ncbi:hypothetical protein BV898_06775 [Hypsibius exemplaris]|uniref:Uncharacterized protein n=1 Tax=Hypsibius exemplaris TaxID=2072580 RepID=A0A1W0WVF1_HYPEX|nr:hypothetical protein BV898_06775 [Hypsibius exemplaris]
MSELSMDARLGFYAALYFGVFASCGNGESVTLMPPENSLNMFVFDMVNGAVPQPGTQQQQQRLPLARFPKHAGVLSGVPIPTLWPVLPILTSTTTRRVKTLNDLANQNKQLLAETQKALQAPTIPAPPAQQNQNKQFSLQSSGSSLYGTAAAQTQPNTGGGLGYLSQVVQPSQPINPSNPFVGSPGMPSIYPSPQLQQQLQSQLQTNAMQYQIPDNSLAFPQNNLLQQQQQIPIGQSFGNIANAQANTQQQQLTAQDILLSASYQANPQQVNAFGSFMPADLTGTGQFNSPSQVYGYGSQQSQSAMLNQLQQQQQQLVGQQQPQLVGQQQQQLVGQQQQQQLVGQQAVVGQQIFSQAEQVAGGQLIQQQQPQNPLGVIPGSAYANSLEEQYPGCHK